MKTAAQRPPTSAKLGGIVNRPPGELKPWPTNPRTHPDKQLAQLKANITRFGFTVPVLVDDHGTILAGHARVIAAKQLGLDAIPTRVVSGLTQADKRAYVLGDNKIALLSAWDPQLLKTEIELLIEDDFDIEFTGFSTAEVDLMFEEPDADADELRPQDIADEAVTRPGDLWRLGDHRLLCGNALEAGAYEVVMGGKPAQMCITDPPYNVPIGGHVCGNGKVRHREFAMASGEMSPDQFSAFLGSAFQQMHASAADGAIVYVFMDWRHAQEMLDAAGPVFGAQLQLCVWDKGHGAMGTFYRSQHELVYLFKKGHAPHINNFELGQHGRYRTNVWAYPGISRFRELLAMHPTVKPVTLIADAMRDCSHRKGLILDPFAGSGTVLIAAERTGRRARAIELEPAYVDVAVRRWQRLTGGRAVLEPDGRSWDDVRAERIDSKDA